MSATFYTDLQTKINTAFTAHRGNPSSARDATLVYTLQALLNEAHLYLHAVQQSVQTTPMAQDVNAGPNTRYTTYHHGLPPESPDTPSVDMGPADVV